MSDLKETKRFTPTIHILLKVEELHHGVLGKLSRVWVSHGWVAGAGEHMAPVLPAGVDASLPHLQEKTLLDAVQDAVGEIDLV